MLCCQGKLKILSLVQREPNTPTQHLNPLSFRLSARLCESRFRKQCRLYEVPLRQSVYLCERNLCARRRSTQVMIRHPMGENTTSLSFHSPLIIPHVPVTFAKIRCGRGSAKDFISLRDSCTRSCEENVF